MKKDIGITIVLIVLCAVTAALNPRFLDLINIQNNLRLIGMYSIFTIGIGMVIITGGIDLSVGSVLALLGIFLYYLLVDWQLPWPLAVTGVLLAGLCIGMIHGTLVTRLKIQPFIVTLCGLLIYRGFARFLAGDSTKGFGGHEGFQTLGKLATGNIQGVPVPFLLMLMVGIVAWVVLHHSPYGRYLFAIGRNEEAVRYSGINTSRVILGAYLIASFLAALAAIPFAFFANAVTPSSHGNFFELYGIAGAVLGGCSLRGGEGTVFGMIIGAAIIQVLQNLVNLLGIPSSLNFAVMGGVILVSVGVDQLVKERKKRTA